MPTAQDLLLQQLFQQIRPQQGLNLPQLGLGTALLGSTLLGREEPGYVTEARQNVRNLSSPTGFASGFTNTVNALKPQFDPLIEQQQNRSLNEISQRYTAAFPGTAGAQPQEFGAYGNYLRDQFLPATNAFYGQMGMQGLNTQYQAANTILQSARPDPFKEGLAALAGSLILGGTGGGGGNLGLGGLNLGSLFGSGQQGGLGGLLGGGNGGQGGLLNQLLGSGSGGAGGIGGLLSGALGLTGSAANPAVASALTSTIGGLLGVPVGAFELLQGGTLGVLGEGGQLLATVGSNGNIVSQTTGQILGNVNQLGGASGAAGQGGGFFGGVGNSFQSMLSGNGLLGSPGFGSLQGLLSGAGSGLAGFGLGNLIGHQLPGTEAGSSAGGAGAGALAGFAIGGPLGAAIGALAGLAGGFLGSQGEAHRIKAQARAADLQAAGTNEASIEQFWTEAIGAAGGDIDPFMQAAQQYGPGQVELIAAEGANQLLQAINRNRPPGQEIASFDQIPGFREKYVSWIMTHNRIEQGGQSVPVQNISQQGGLLAAAGFGQSNTAAITATGPNVSHYFSNPDSPTRAEMDSLAAKVRAAGYNGPHASDLGDLLFRYTPGRIAVQVANGLIQSMRDPVNYVPLSIFRQSGIQV